MSKFLGTRVFIPVTEFFVAGLSLSSIGNTGKNCQLEYLTERAGRKILYLHQRITQLERHIKR